MTSYKVELVDRLPPIRAVSSRQARRILGAEIGDAMFDFLFRLPAQLATPTVWWHRAPDSSRGLPLAIVAEWKVSDVGGAPRGSFTATFSQSNGRLRVEWRASNDRVFGWFAVGEESAEEPGPSPLMIAALHVILKRLET